MKKILVWAAIGFLFFLSVFFIKKTSTEAATGYCRIGADPVNPGLLLEGEKVYKLPQDIPVKIKGGSGKISDCTLRAGEEVVLSETASGSWRIIRVYNCGNPILSEAYAEAPQGPRQAALQPAPSPTLAPQQQYSQPFPAPQQTPPSQPTGPPINVSYYGGYGGSSSYDSNRAYDDYYSGGSGGYAPQLFGAAIGSFGAAILGNNQYSQPPPPTVIYNDSFNNTGNGRGQNSYGHDRSYRNSGGNNSYDSYYSNRGQGGGYRGTKYCPPPRAGNINTGNPRRDYLNQTIRGGGNGRTRR